MESGHIKVEEDLEPLPAKRPKQTQDQACQVDGIPGTTSCIFLILFYCIASFSIDMSRDA